MSALFWILVGLVVAGVIAWNYPSTWNWLLTKGSEVENKVSDTIKDKIDNK